MSEFKPALTPEEWATRTRNGTRPARDYDTIFDGSPPKECHLIAAEALQDQPFGFTWEDVDTLRGASSTLGSAWGDGLHDLADRIAALLPPRA